MKKTIQEKLTEINNIMEESAHLLEKSRMNLESAKFLNSEADRLVKLADDDSLPFDERERLFNQLIFLVRKIEWEQETMIKDDERMKYLTKRLEELRYE